jgi:hypothetical protein
VKSNLKIVLIVLGAIVVVFILSSLFGGGTKTRSSPTGTPQESAWYACTSFVERQIGLSTFDAQRYNASGVTDVSSGHFLVKVYYAKNNGFYRCEILHRSDGNWQLLGLDALQ